MPRQLRTYREDGCHGAAVREPAGEERNGLAADRTGAPATGAAIADLPEAMRIYDSMKARHGATWHCTPEEWLRCFNACRSAGGGVIGCAALACASCHPV